MALNVNDALSGIDSRFALEFLSTMVRQKSYTRSAGEHSLVKWMDERMRESGLSSELMRFDGDRFNAIGRWKGTGSGNSLMFNGHLDTNPVSEGWTVDPWGGLVDSQFIYGIGVSNMKAGCAAYFCAVKTLIDLGVRLKGDVILTYVVGELQGGVGSHAMMKEGYRADYFVNSEPTDLQALTVHAGSFNFLIELVGRTRHLSKREEGVDAIAAACDLVPRLNAMSFSGATSAEHRAITRVHVGVMRGALGKEMHEWRPAQVADYAVLKGSGRFAPGQTEASAKAEIAAQIEEVKARFPGLNATLSDMSQDGRLTMPPFEVALDNEIVTATNNAYEIVRGSRQPTGLVLPPSYYGTDAGHLYAAGMPGIVCGPGGRYNTMPDERVDIVDFIDAIKMYILIILRICG